MLTATRRESALVALLERLAEGLPPPPGRISSALIESRLRHAVAALSTLGEFNFLLADGFHLVAYATDELAHVATPSPSRGAS
jgi:hypothetical protein